MWESIGCPEPRCLLMFDPIGMLLGGIIVEKIMRGDYVGYAAARASFVTHMQSSTFRPYHLWVVMSWTGLVWGSTREIDGLADLLTWVQNTVPERFRGTGLPETRRMRVRSFTLYVLRSRTLLHASSELMLLCIGHHGYCNCYCYCLDIATVSETAS
jgi:hypothetical protein